MLPSNCRKNFNDVPRQIQKTNEKPLLFVAKKKVEMYSPSKAVARNLGEEVLLDRPRPTTIKRERKTVTSKTDLRDHMTEPGPLYRVIRNINSWLIRSQVTQSSELSFNNNTFMIFMIPTLVRPNVYIWFDNTLVFETWKITHQMWIKLYS